MTSYVFNSGLGHNRRQIGEQMDRLKSGTRDTFTKHGIEVTVLKNKTIEAEAVFEKWWGVLQNIGKSEALKNLREVMSRAGLDKNLFNLMIHRDEFLPKAEAKRESLGGWKDKWLTMRI